MANLAAVLGFYYQNVACRLYVGSMPLGDEPQLSSYEASDRHR